MPDLDFSVDPVDGSDMFALTAKAFALNCTTDRSLPHIERSLQAYDPALSLAWNNDEGRFYVMCQVGARGGPNPVEGFKIPLFPLDTGEVSHDEVMNEIRRRDLRGRSKDAARKRQAALQASKQAAQSRLLKEALPCLPEYLTRVLQADDEWTQKQLIQEFAKEQKRAVNEGASE